MSASEHHTAFDNLGAFALGALPDDERELVADHIESCPICAEDAASLQRAATRLMDIVPSLEPSPAVRDRIMAIVEPEAALLRAANAPRSQPRRERRRFAATFAPSSLRWVAAGAALLAIGAALGSTLPGGDAGSPATRTLDAQVGHGHAWVETDHGRAQLVVNDLPAPPAHKVYEVWIQHGSEPARPDASNLRNALFVVGSGKIDIPAHLEPGDRVMVTAEPAGGSQQPTSIPVVITSRV
jgi:anti-sigma-K factor RskA